MGRLALRSGECGTARDLHEEYLTIERELGNRSNEAEALAFLAEIAQAEGDDREAMGLLEESVRVQRSMGDRAPLVWLLGTLGEVAFRAGQPDRARSALDESAAIAGQRHDSHGLARARVRLAMLARAEGDHGQVARLCAQALAGTGPDAPAGMMTELADLLAGVAVRAGDAVLAARLLGAAGTLRATLDYRDVAYETGPQYRQDVAATRDALGAVRFDAARAEGATVPQPEIRALLAAAAITGD